MAKLAITGRATSTPQLPNIPKEEPKKAPVSTSKKTPELKGGAAFEGSTIAESSSDEGAQNVAVGLYGPPGVGKTICALTSSQFWPKVIPSPTKVVLADVLHVAWDPDAVTGLREMNIEVPTINIKKLMRPLGPEEKDAAQRGAKVRPFARNILDAMTLVNREQLLFAEQANKKFGTCYIVQDTTSWLNSQLEKWYIHGDGCPTTKTGARDTRKGWILLSGAHDLFIHYNLNTPATILYLYHATAMVENLDTEEGREQAKKNKAAGLTDIVPSITGRSKNTYNANMSATFWMTKRSSVRGGGFDRKLHTQDVGGALTKNRWALSLEPEEPADMAAIFAKIRKPYEQ